MAAVVPNWVMLDRYVFRRGHDVSLPNLGYASLMAEGTTFQGVSFRVALCLADPPAASRFYVLFPSRPEPGRGTACDLVAAHGNLLLFVLTDAVKAGELSDRLCYQDHFVCRVASPGQQLRLRRLPECTERRSMGVVDGVEINVQRLFHSEAVGLLGRDEQEFAVAQLERICQLPDSGLEAEISNLRTRASCDDGATWEVKRFPIVGPEQDLKNLAWSSATVVSFNKYICWVDYHMGGILFLDVFEESPKVSYLGLPARFIHPYEPQSYLEMFSSVCVTGDGNTLKFIHVDREYDELLSPMTPVSRFTITSHTLDIPESGAMKWFVDAAMKSDELSLSSHPQHVLTFPLLSMEKAQLVHLLLSEPMDDHFDKISVVNLDMNTNTVVSVEPYIKGDEDRKGEDADMLLEKYYYPKGFLPSKFIPSVTRKRKIEG